MLLIVVCSTKVVVMYQRQMFEQSNEVGSELARLACSRWRSLETSGLRPTSHKHR